MPLLREKQTGSVVNVPEEKVDRVVALGYYEHVDQSTSSVKKATAKKAASSNSEK